MGIGDKVEQWVSPFDLPGYLDRHPHAMLFLVTLFASLLVAVLVAMVVVQVLLRPLRRQIRQYGAVTAAQSGGATPQPTFRDHASITDPDEIAPHPMSLTSEPAADAVAATSK